jgi:hypothetical protein
LVSANAEEMPVLAATTSDRTVEMPIVAVESEVDRLLKADRPLDT